MPLYSSDTSAVTTRKLVVEQVNRLLIDWEKTPHPVERSYLFIQNDRKYWIALIPHSLSMRAVAYATTEEELKMVENFAKNIYESGLKR